MTKASIRSMFVILILMATGALTAASVFAQSSIPIGGGIGVLKPIPLKPVGAIFIRGLKYNDHTANTSISTHQINAGDFFRIATRSLFYGNAPGLLAREIRVVIEDVNAPSAISGGITVFQLKNVVASGQILTVQSPTLAILRNRTYHVTVFVYVADGSRHYANAGTLTVH